MSESNIEAPGGGDESVHGIGAPDTGVDLPELFHAPPEGLAPGAELIDPGPSSAMISAIAGTSIPENLASHWDHDGALRIRLEPGRRRRPECSVVVSRLAEVG